MLKYHSTVIFVRNIDKAKHFYCDLLSIPVDMDMGKNVILQNGITLWEISDENLMAKTIGKALFNKGHKFELYFETDNLEQIADFLTKNGIQIIHPIHEEPWGQRTIRFFDCDNNIIEAGETLNTFLQRMIKSGMGMEEVCRKTGMKEEDIRKVTHYDI